MATVGAAAEAFMWTAPSASADSDFCNSLPNPRKLMSATAASTSPRVLRSFKIAWREKRLRLLPRNLS